MLVDGYNVTMSRWPSCSAAEQRRELERRAATIAARHGSSITLVFDGIDEGGRPSRAVGSVVRVRFTANEVEADDEILEIVGEVTLDRPVVVVSSDRRVVDGARERGANVVGSTTFGELLGR